MKDEYRGLYVDREEIRFCCGFKDKDVFKESFSWQGDFVKLDKIFEDKKNYFNKVFLTFDGGINEYDQLHIMDLLENKEIKVENISHRFISFMLSYIYYLWVNDKKEICDIDQEKNFLLIEIIGFQLNIGVISFSNTAKSLTWENLGYTSFSNVEWLKEYENDSLFVKSMVKSCIEEFYVCNKNKLREILIDDLVFAGEFNKFQGLTDYILSLFNKREGIYIEEKNYGSLGAFLNGLIKIGKPIFPFSKNNIVYVEKDLFIYQSLGGQVVGDSTFLVGRSVICPVRDKKSIILNNAIINPITFTIAQKDDDKLYEIENIYIYLPFFYYGDIINIDFYIDEEKNVKVDIVHDRTKETSSLQFKI